MNIWILYQTDLYKTASSKVLFGVFDSYDKAMQEAKDNDLFTHESEVVIETTTLNQFGEV